MVYMFRRVHRLPLLAIRCHRGHLRIRRGPEEVTHSRLEDNGMRHRYAICTQYCYTTLHCIRYDRQAYTYFVIPLTHFQSFYIVCRSGRIYYVSAPIL